MWRYVHMMLHTYVAQNHIWHTTADAVVCMWGERGMEGVEEHSRGCKKTPWPASKICPCVIRQQECGFRVYYRSHICFRIFPITQGAFHQP